MTLSFDLDRTILRLVSTAQESTHDNRESETTTGDAADLVPGPVLRYRQRLTTVGAEADVRLDDRGRVIDEEQAEYGDNVLIVDPSETPSGDETHVETTDGHR